MSGRSRRPWARAAPPPGTRWPSEPSRGRRPWPLRGRRLKPSLSVRTLAAQVFLFQALIMLMLVAVGAAALVVQGRYDAEHSAMDRSLAVAESFAHAPGTAVALRSPDASALLQPQAEQVRKGSGVDFVTVLDRHGVRVTDPDPALIGTKAQGVGRAAAGETFTETFHGRPADAVRAVVPVNDPSRRVVGMVTAGIEYANVGEVLNRQLPLLLGAAAGALVLAMGGAALVSRRLLRQTHGLGPVQMTRMYEHHDAVLHAVREGVLIVGGDGRVLLANDEARRLLDLPEDADRRQVPELGLGPVPTRLLVAGEAVSDEVVPVGDRLLAVNVRPTAPYGGGQGLVATFRDTTELRALSGQAEVARGRLSFLYEAGVRIGTTLDVRRTAEELTEVAVPRMADVVSVELLDAVLRGEEPTGAVHAMRRTAVRAVRAGHPLQPVGDVIRFVMADTPMVAALRRGKAVLVPDLGTAQDWRAQDPEGAQAALRYGIHSMVSVPLRARGVVLGMVNFWRGAGSPRFEEEDVAVAEELVARAAVAIDNARRYSREHAMAVTLQRNLLPLGLPEQDVLEIASRYLPAQSGVGGDWFDVIPLPGFRVALVVGDIVGHGMQAAVTMGRLRTAVLNFSSLDLAPDELLGRLDEMVTRLDTQSADADDDRVPLTGATCLYVVYDPVGGHCTLSRAGHLAPAVVDPEGGVSFPDLPLAPPLGVGGHPFEAGELDLPEGSRLVLFTDGLIENRGRDIDEGIEMLCSTVARTDRTPEETCRALVERMLPEHPSDDVALLVARTRLLNPSCVAAWDVPFDVTAVPRVRGEVTRRLADWGLEEVSFTTELILSELLTNAIRYGAPPVRVRLLLGRTLVCEVSDGSNTSPRLRQAATTDEGGRGLFLVSQFADMWGTRYVTRGKVIWAEQSLDRAAEPDPAVLFDVMGL
ncbi:SpoIIE family protein phosphatase [Streptomyces echinatus]|uniref:protein-serine/threonine phosphatase n=1 Tax=Streptomyces echinatus TaxID=67293 RepID=A0A7W9Q062_9ACTN|nr:SpoIIE family protein phosphatase [Streptomyces echinatus]MBB5930909.1 serine phosphatase RsbU (regulator of sigma subunit)/PAS domain-containing protein/anti-sigma regulatory factor (Ser/Thr protein kinase) [Streptomyces echinatus]